MNKTELEMKMTIGKRNLIAAGIVFLLYIVLLAIGIDVAVLLYVAVVLLVIGLVSRARAKQKINKLDDRND